MSAEEGSASVASETDHERVAQAAARVDFYQLLEVERSADEVTIRKSYRRLALKYHPDRNAGNADATALFQQLSVAYSILSDANKRRLYDETGTDPDYDGGEVNEKNTAEWVRYFAQKFMPVTEDSIEAFRRTYIGSSAERDDVLEAYLSTDGCLQEMLDWVPLSSEDDAERFRALVEAAIEAGTHEALGDFIVTTAPSHKKQQQQQQQKKKRAAPRKRKNEEAEAAALARELKLNTKDNLAVAIRGKSSSRAKISDGLAALMAQADENGPPDLPEEAFAATAARTSKRPKTK